MATLPQTETICESDQNGRILKSDHSGRSLWVVFSRRPVGVRKLTLLSDLAIGEEAILGELQLPEAVQNQLMYMGFVPGARNLAVRHAPAGDPTVYAVDGMEIALRRETAESIRLRPASGEIKPGVGVPELVETSR